MTAVHAHAAPYPPITRGLVTMVAANVVAGAPAYFVAFLFAYGFRDVVGAPEHVAFLVMVSLFGVLTGLLGAAAVVASTTGRRRWRCATVVVPASLSLNYLVVAAGSVVSALHKQEGSVSAAFSTTTDVLVAGGLLAAAAVLALVARRAELSRRGRSPR